MKKFFLLLALACAYLNGISQVFFPVDASSGKVYYHLAEEMNVSKNDKYNRTKTWFMNYYKTSRFEEHFKIAKKGRPLHLIETKTRNSITGRCGFYIMYPSEASAIVMEQAFVMFTMTIKFNGTGYENQITDMIYFASKTNADGRPPQFGLEAYNAQQLNRLDYVQQHIIPQITKSVTKVQQDLSRNIRYGNLTEVSW